jgi:hypothetical protein
LDEAVNAGNCRLGTGTVLFGTRCMVPPLLQDLLLDLFSPRPQ